MIKSNFDFPSAVLFLATKMYSKTKLLTSLEAILMPNVMMTMILCERGYHDKLRVCNRKKRSKQNKATSPTPFP